jgi:hypothetical protein
MILNAENHRQFTANKRRFAYHVNGLLQVRNVCVHTNHQPEN